MKKNQIKKDLIYTLNWDWLQDLNERAVVGTMELSNRLFTKATIKPTVKFAYISTLIAAGHFAKPDGMLGKSNYWHKDTLEKFKQEIEDELKKAERDQAKSIAYLSEFEEKRKNILKKINMMDETKKRIDYFKSIVLEELLDELSNAPTEVTEDLIITEISNIWKVCRKG